MFAMGFTDLPTQAIFFKDDEKDGEVRISENYK